MFNLMQLARKQGVKKKTIKLKPTKPKLADKRDLQAIGNEMVRLVYEAARELAADLTPPFPVLATDDGEAIGILKDAADDIDRIISLIVTQTQHVMVRLQAKVRNWSVSVEEHHRDQFVESAYHATKVNLDTILHPSQVDKTVGHYATWASSLIRDIGEEARKKIAHATLEAIRTQQTPAQLATTIREYEDMSYRRAKNIAADQTNKLNAALDRARQQEVGITGFTWIHSGNPHPREEHLDRDGEFFEWDNNDIDPGDYPGEPPFCGCSAQATLVDESGQETETDEADLEDAA